MLNDEIRKENNKKNKKQIMVIHINFSDSYLGY
jgi:hypothetical protein